MTVAELRAKLSVIEPTEAMYTGITARDVPELEKLLADKEAWLAARSAFALSRVGSKEAVDALARAAGDKRSQVRVAVASAVGQRPITLPDKAVLQILHDPDPGVRKFATKAVKNENGDEPHSVLRRLASNDAVPLVREYAAEALRKLRKP